MGRWINTVSLTILTPVTLALVSAQNGPTAWTVQPFNSPAFPLAVKTPYLNTWLPQGNGPVSVNDQWPQLWTINDVSYSDFFEDGVGMRGRGKSM